MDVERVIDGVACARSSWIVAAGSSRCAVREDMAKLMVLRGRSRPWHERPFERGRRRDVELLPKREPMGRGWGGKSLGENFGPLLRFLERRVGCRWNDVHSEICARLDRSNAVQRHVFVHLDEFVRVHVHHVDGVPHDERGRPLWRSRWRRFHVDEAGVLRRNPVAPRTLP